MAEYRLFLLDQSGAIEGRIGFNAIDDEIAWRIASVVAHACADEHRGWMLWQGAKRLFEGVRIEGQTMVVGYDDLSIEARQTILSCEEDLLKSHWRAAKSERMRSAVERMRAELTGEAE